MVGDGRGRTTERGLYFAVVCLILLSATGCTTATYNAIVPETGMERIRNVSYGPRDRQKLDVYRPRDMASTRPVVIFVHGGSWNKGSKDKYYFVARSLVDGGYVAVLPNYRLIPTARYPAFVKDTARAVSWTFENIDQYGGRSSSIFIMGHSAGAYNAAMVAYDDRYLQKFGIDNSRLRGFIGLAGLYDFLPLTHDHLRKVFGHVDDKQQTQPVHFVDPEDPEALLFHGTNDIIVDPVNSDRMNRVLNRKGPGGIFHFKHSQNHVYLLLSIGPYFRTDYNNLKLIKNFITDHLPDQPPGASK